MKNIILLIVLMPLFVTGCGRSSACTDKSVVAKINNYEVTKDEFEKEFFASSFGRRDTLESRKEFLTNLINRKLILQDAGRRGLDKDPAFLGMIQRFWEQSLLKLAIERKTKEIANSSFVSDKKVEEVYLKMRKDGKTDKPYSTMGQQIKWEITKLKESQMIDAWLVDMRNNSEIKINYDLIKSDKQEE